MSDIDEFELELYAMTQEEMEKIANGEDEN